MKYKNAWEELTQKMGYWIDLKEPYITFDNNYIESVWYLLKQLYEKGLLYKGYTIQPYSPAAGTGLSSHELNLPGCYKDVTDTTVTAQFQIIRNKKSEFLFPDRVADNVFQRRGHVTSPLKTDVYFLAWTTTPWTLPSNCALAVGKKINYIKVKTFNQYTHQAISVVLAKDLVNKFFPEKTKDLKLKDYKPEDKLIPYDIKSDHNYKGSELEGINYEQLMPYVQPEGDAFRVIIGDFVSTEEGTGIVHTASVFGADDFRVCRQNNVPSILVKDEDGNDMPLVDKQGRFVKEVTDFSGKYVRAEYENPETTKDPAYKSTDVLIAIKLKEENKAFIVAKYEHSYPHCWRTDKPILYYPLDSWFIKTTDAKEKLMKLNNTINWKPASTGTGRFGNWLENLQDWNLSRSRFWGTPLPIWECEKCENYLVAGGLDDLDKYAYRTNKFYIMRHGEAAHNVGEWLSGDGKSDKKARLTSLGVEQAEKSAGFDREDRFRNRFYFSHLYTAADQLEFQRFLGIHPVRSLKGKPVSKSHLPQLKELMIWLYGSKAAQKEPIVRSQSPDLNRLREV
ncbi:MAG: class I tRNA ligase family protein, partial [Proteobacteria bacterium]|nr:class I tRNA ligase family protein [Pseudomonadota bacterium]